MAKRCSYRYPDHMQCSRNCYGLYCFQHKPRKAIKQKGKHTIEYEEWRDNVAIPYLDATYGHSCVHCGATGKLDVDHIKPRGSHYNLRMVLSNVQYLCRNCHRAKTDRLNNEVH